MKINLQAEKFDRVFYDTDKPTAENILTFGAESYINELDLWLGGKNIPHNTLIGRYCSLSHALTFQVARNHHYNFVTTRPLKLMGVEEKNIPYFKNPRQIIIGHDVWIGHGVIVLGGVKIGNGAVIGAGAVVAKDIPPYAIAVGNPARVIKYRFDAETIKKFLAVKWWNWDLEKIRDNAQLMTDVEKFLETHYSPELEKIHEDILGQHVKNIRVGGGGQVYNFIADFRAKNPLWLRVVAGFCQSQEKNLFLVIWADKNSTDKDIQNLADVLDLFETKARENVFVVKSDADKNFSPYALRQGTHFITTREMVTLEALDYLWDTDVKIISALDDGIFIGEPLVDWNKFLK